MKTVWWVLTMLVVMGGAEEAEFECPGSSDCTCSKGISGRDYDILCPRASSQIQPTLIGRIEPGSLVQLQCTSKEGQELALVEGFKIGPIQRFALKLCPLPNVSFKQFMDSMGVPSTVSLQVQSHANLSDTFKPMYLAGLHQVTRLYLDNNGLTSLDEDLFRDMSNLTWLDLKNNNIGLPRGIFRHVPKLEVLELGSNNLSSIEPGLFRNLTRLRLLNLWSNRLRNLTRTVFSDVPNLERLDLNSNGLVTITPDIFADLAKLKNINLYGNDFIALPQGLFLSTPKLEQFQVHNNRRTLRTLPGGLLANLTQLKEVFLNSCNMSRIPEDLLWGSKNLANLTLRNNLFVALPSELLRDATELQNLDLSRNRLVSLPDGLFKTLEKLSVLNLSYNKLTNLSAHLFSRLNKLQVLRMEHNSLSYISPQAFQAAVSLQTVDLSYNNIDKFYAEYSDPTFGRHSLLQTSVTLRGLHLSHNNISEIFSDWQVSMTQLEVLDLSYNKLQNLTIADLQFVSTNLKLDVSYNRISVIVMDTAEELALMKYKKGENRGLLENTSVRVSLKGNPLQCDCQAFALVRYFSGKLTPEVNYIAEFDPNNLTCAGPEGFVGMSVKGLDERLLSCSIQGEECPGGCECHYRPHDIGLLVDCSGRGLTRFPPFMPADIYTLNLTNHTELNLSNNSIRQLPTILGPGYERVTKFFLSDNNITTINTTVLPPQIQVLELDKNNLTRMSIQSLRFLQEATMLEKVTMHDNPWHCDCEAKYFLNFLHSSFKKVPMLGNITCKSGGVLSKMTASELCPTSGVAWGVGVFVAVVGVLMGAMAAVYYRYQREIKVWLYAHRFCLWLVTEQELDKDKLYDAFVSYSHQDEDFVVNKLVPGLEEGPTKFKLCLHYRDWIVGDFIPNQIARSVEDSRRTVVVLSPNFLESVWGRMEFRAAHSQALSEGRARVVVILYGDIGPTEDLDPELKAYLSMNTYVKWGDPWFWDKLRYALPHPPHPTKALFPLLSRQKPDTLVPDPLALNTPPANAVIVDPLSSISDSKPV